MSKEFIRTPEQRKNISDGVTQAHREGKLADAVQMGLDARMEKYGDYFSPAARQAGRDSDRTQKSIDARIKKYGSAMPPKTLEAARNRIRTPAERAKISERSKERGVAHLFTAEVIAKRKANHRPRTVSDEQAAEQSRKMLAYGSEHPCGLVMRVRSPENAVYAVSNVTQFVRENEHLFPPETVVWRGTNCHAAAGLRRLSPTNTQTKGTWRGWTLVSGVEVHKNKDKDLLDRRAEANPFETQG